MATTEKNQHPSVEGFKEFVKKHPKLIKEVRSNKKSWQDLYEDWVILGENDEMWDPYKRDANSEKVEESQNSKKKMEDIIAQVFSYAKKMDFEELQQHMTNLNGAITNVQEIVQQFQSIKKPSNNSGTPQRLPFRKD